MKDVQSIGNIVHDFHFNSTFFGLKTNLTKFEVAGIGALNEVKVLVCGM